MVQISWPYILQQHCITYKEVNKLFTKKYFVAKQHFLICWSLESLMLTLGSAICKILRKSDGKCTEELNYLSNAIFIFAIAIIVTEIMEFFSEATLANREQNRKFGHF